MCPSGSAGVDGDLAEVVEHDAQPLPPGVIQEVVEQRGLAAAEKTREDHHGHRAHHVLRLSVARPGPPASWRGHRHAHFVPTPRGSSGRVGVVR